MRHFTSRSSMAVMSSSSGCVFASLTKFAFVFVSALLVFVIVVVVVLGGLEGGDVFKFAAESTLRTRTRCGNVSASRCSFPGCRLAV